MKKIIFITTMVLLAGFTLSAADNKTTAKERRATKKDIDSHIQAINKLDNTPAALRSGMAAASKETAVPLPTIEAEHKEHPKVGVAGLLVAHMLATHTQKSADHFIKQHSEGKTWRELAQANNEDLDALDQKLTRLEDAMRGRASVDSGDRTAVRERTADVQSSFDKRVQALNGLEASSSVRRSGLSAVSKETAVPLPTLEEAQKQNPNAGLGDLFVAQELSTHTQKPVGDFLKMHADGKSWSEIIRAQNQDASEIEKKIGRVEEAAR